MRKENLVNWRFVEFIDTNVNGIRDDIEPPQVDVTASATELRHRIDLNTSSDPHICCGDLDACWEMSESIGDEAPGGSSVTPDQNVVEDFGQALGIIYRDGEELWLVEKEHGRDLHRWELDPASSDDFHERTHAPSGPRKPKSRMLH